MSKERLIRFWHRFNQESLLFKFSGRATRREFLFFACLSLLTVIIALSVGTDGFSVLVAGMGLIILLAASIRRVHDGGNSAWVILGLGVPYIGIGMYLFFVFSGADEYANKYGPNPRHKFDFE